MSEESRIDGLQKIGALQAEHEFIKPDAWLGRCSGLIYTNVTRIAVEQWVANLSKPMSAASITPLYRVQIPVISSLANERILLKDRIAELERENEALRKDAQWRPRFDVMEPEQERLAIQFCEEIAGRRGEKGRVPDPVRLLEMAEALYKAEADAAIKEQSK